MQKVCRSYTALGWQAVHVSTWALYIVDRKIIFQKSSPREEDIQCSSAAIKYFKENIQINVNTNATSVGNETDNNNWGSIWFLSIGRNCHLVPVKRTELSLGSCQ